MTLGYVMVRLSHKARRLRLRAQWSIQLRGVQFDPYTTVRVHPSVVFEGDGVVLHGSVNIRQNGRVKGPCEIGRSVFVNAGVWVSPYTHIGDRCSIGPFVRFVTDSHLIGGATKRAGETTHEPITIGEGSWIGAGAMVLPGVTVGPGAVIAAGAIVTKDVQQHTLVAGVPARAIRTLPTDGP
jgi:acetyltransferase-like isoleucine patch superfamily enzyme